MRNGLPADRGVVAGDGEHGRVTDMEVGESAPADSMGYPVFGSRSSATSKAVPLP